MNEASEGPPAQRPTTPSRGHGAPQQRRPYGRQYVTLVLAGVVTLFMAIGCRSQQLFTAPIGDNNITITVSAAASLQGALGKLSPRFSQTHANITVDYNFAASGTLQRQIEQGAPTDVFFSAATRQMDALLAKDLILQKSHQALLTNRLVLIAPVASELVITDVDQLKDTTVNRIAVGEFRSVPAGQYAQQVFTRLGLWEAFQTKFIFGNSVRNVLAAVESGNVELGIVYASDAALSDRVKVLVTVPMDLHQPIVYPIAVLQTSSHPDAAQAFVDFLTTDEAQKVFRSHGFAPI